MFCRQCGAPLKDNQRFCSACGAPVEDADARAAAAGRPSISYGEATGAQRPLKSRLLWVGAAAAAVFIIIGVIFLWRSSGNASLSQTIQVPGNRGWTPTGIFLEPGAAVAIVASGSVSMGRGWTPLPPSGRPQLCPGGNFPAPQGPCWSLIGRVGGQGSPFYVGNQISFRAPASGQLFLGVNDNILGDNSGNWMATVTVGSGATFVVNPTTGSQSELAAGQPVVVKAITQGGASLQLPPGRFYVYGFATGGAAPSSPFAMGQYAQAVDAAGQIAAALAYGTNDQNSYPTQTGFQVIGGASIDGPWDGFNAFYGSNSQPGASNVSVNFTVSEKSLVVVIGLASSQQSVELAGIPGLQIDASSSGPGASEGMVIAHAYLGPGVYTASEQSAALAGGQDPDHMADLIGVFAFGLGH